MSYSSYIIERYSCSSVSSWYGVVSWSQNFSWGHLCSRISVNCGDQNQ